jgi:hypothetical protein
MRIDLDTPTEGLKASCAVPHAGPPMRAVRPLRIAARRGDRAAAKARAILHAMARQEQPRALV